MAPHEIDVRGQMSYPPKIFRCGEIRFNARPIACVEHMTHTLLPPIPLDQETRSMLPTNEAARHLNRSPQTLRLWACKQNGPLRPNRVNGRLGWSVDTLRELTGVVAC